MNSRFVMSAELLARALSPALIEAVTARRSDRASSRRRYCRSAGRRGIGRVLAGAIVGLKSSGPDRCLDVGRVRFVRQVTEGAAAVQVAVRVGIGDGVRASGGQHGVLQAERSEQTALETTGQRLPLNLFCDEAEQRVIGVRVVERSEEH